MVAAQAPADTAAVTITVGILHPPEVTGLVPDIGPAGSQIWIHGSGFADARGSSRVVFGPGQIEAIEYMSWSDTAINCRVVEGLSPGVNEVRVVVDGQPSNARPFTVTEPSELCVDDSNGTGSENGTEPWPFNTIGEAVAAAGDGAVIKVASGTYAENIVVKGKSVALAGGYPGGTYPGTGSFDDGSRDTSPFTNQTTLDGNYAGSVVTFQGDATSDSLLTGFVLMLGKAEKGGGIYCNEASPTIERMVLGGNQATSCGGGICCDAGAAPTIRDTRLQDNTAGLTGGGIYCDASSPTVTACEFLSNEATGSGGGMANATGASPRVRSCTFSENWAGVYGGGMSNFSAAPSVGSCQFTGNSAPHGAGMANGGSSGTVVNCTFAGNQAAESGGGIFNSASSSPTIANCILWGNLAPSASHICNHDAGSQATVSHCDLQGGLPAGCVDGGGNIDAAPEFAAPGHWQGAEWIEGDYHLAAVSPCIHRGSNAALPIGLADDIDGEARIQYSVVDIGADETPWSMAPPSDPGHLTMDTDPLVGGKLNPTGPAPKSLTMQSLDTNGNLPDVTYAIGLSPTGPCQCRLHCGCRPPRR